MKYKVTVFGVKDTSENMVEFIHSRICPVDLVITIHPKVLDKNQVSGFKGLSVLTDRYGIPVFEADSYFLTDQRTREFMEGNEFEIAISMGWQRLIPDYVLDRFSLWGVRLPWELRLPSLWQREISLKLVHHPGRQQVQPESVPV